MRRARLVPFQQSICRKSYFRQRSTRAPPESAPFKFRRAFLVCFGYNFFIYTRYEAALNARVEKKPRFASEKKILLPWTCASMLSPLLLSSERVAARILRHAESKIFRDSIKRDQIANNCRKLLGADTNTNFPVDNPYTLAAVFARKTVEK